MRACIDHVIYGTSDLDGAAARIEAELGVPAAAGGRHDGVGTENRIVALGDGSFIELLAIADEREARSSALGAALLAGIAGGDGLLGWAVAVQDVGSVAARLGLAVTTVGRQGMTASLVGVKEALGEPCLPFFIQRAEARFASEVEPVIVRIEVAGDAGRLRRWLGDAELPVTVLDGPPGVRAVVIAGRELRGHAGPRR
ncbi:MAG: VOC family protein [Solirubrobacteraceae bacterium]|jgi:hypothetical protein